uniref:Transcriptional activator of proteases prtT n=1 Tax=Bionectria ochroleuca TaxID=29856 RepID=A0A8H7K6H7_BIOOC
MPQQRRVLTCSSCRRLKTRCNVPTGSSKCIRCTNLGIECELPYAVHRTNTTETEKTGTPVSIPAQHPCACNDRLAAVETSLADIQQTLRLLVQQNSAPSVTSTGIRATIEGEEGLDPSITSPGTRNEKIHAGSPQQDIKIAPVQTIREMSIWINGAHSDKDLANVEGEGSTADLESEETANYLINCFRRISPRLNFIHPYIGNGNEPCHSLLSMTCVLAGSLTAENVHGTGSYKSLYVKVRNTLGKSMLATPLSLPTIYSMLISSTFNLHPTFQSRYIDTWLLSGSTLLHLMLFMDFSFPDGVEPLEDEKTRSQILAWNSACLIHLKFSLGTGKLSVVEPDRLTSFITIVNQSPRSTQSDRSVASELQLYSLLYKAIIQKALPEAEIRNHIEQWHKNNDSESDLSLDMGFSAVMLVLERWQLAQRHQETDKSAPTQQGEATITYRHCNEGLINSMLRHCTLVLEGMGKYAAAIGPTTTYDLLLGAYAAVTLVEYSDYLSDVKQVFDLMQTVSDQWPSFMSLEPVFDWAKSMMSKRVAERGNQSAAVSPLNSIFFNPSDTWWTPLDFITYAGTADDADIPMGV